MIKFILGFFIGVYIGIGIMCVEIIELTNDLKYADNKELRIFGLERIQDLAWWILDHLYI